MKFYTHVENRGNTILYRGYDENGKRVQFKDASFRPTLFVNSKNSSTSKYKTIHGIAVDPIQPGDIRECRDFVENYSNVPNFKIYGNTGWLYQYISSQYPNHEDATYDMSTIRKVVIDIETQTEEGFPNLDNPVEQINVLTIRMGRKRWVFGVGQFSLPADSDLDQRMYDNDTDMLKDFISVWQEIDPDILTGWYCRSFDIPYLIARIIKLLGENYAKKLSPWNSIEEEELDIRGKMCKVYKIAGIATLDYYELYRKYSLSPQENYKLDHIAFVELGKKKLDYSEYAGFRDFYTRNFQKFVEYNVVDVDLVEEIDEKLNMVELHVSLAYFAKVNYEDAFGPVKSWDMIIYNHLLKKDIVVPLKVKREQNEQYAGAYVKDPVVGLHDWVVSYDINSMYPMRIIGSNISPETLIENPEIKFEGLTVDALLSKSIDTSELKKYDYALCANGHMFSRKKKGFLAELMDDLYIKRKASKKKSLEYKKLSETDPANALSHKKLSEKFNTEQMAAKIFLNSAYGALGNFSFRYFDIRQAEAITLTGQLSIRWIQQELNKKINSLLKTTDIDYVVYSDTDSVVGESIINVNNKDMTISDYYNSQEILIKNDRLNQYYVKSCKNSITPSVNEQGKIEFNKITHAMKHKVKKKLFRIKTKSLSVDVTEDHSVIVRIKKSGDIVSIKPQELNSKIHKILNIAGDTDSGASNEAIEVEQQIKNDKKSL